MSLKTVTWSCESSQIVNAYPQFSMESTELFYEKSPHNFTFDVQRSHRVLTILQIIGPGSEVTHTPYPKGKLSLNQAKMIPTIPDFCKIDYLT